MNDVTQSQDPNRVDRGGSQTDLRRYNERVVLAALDRHPGLFNAELARRTGLAAQTISVILRALDRQGLIMRGPALRGRRGQPATPLFLKPDAAFGLGAGICWRGLSVCLTDFSGAVLAENRSQYGYPAFDETLEALVGHVPELVASIGDRGRGRIAGLGIALPAAMERCLKALDAPSEVVRSWHDRDFAAELADALGLPVWPIRYGVAASGAEARLPGRNRSDDFAYFFIGTLLMGGIVSRNGAAAGAGPDGSMLGAMLVPGRDGKSVRADTIVSGWGLEKALEAGGAGNPRSVGPEWDWMAERDIVEPWLEEAARAFAHVIVNTRCAFDPDTIIVDGILSPSLTQALIDKIADAFGQLPMEGEKMPTVRIGQSGIRGAALGAAQFSFHQQFFNTDPPS